MADPRHPTNKEWVMIDPLVEAPPSGDLLIINEGGTLKVMPWYEGALCWARKPVIPQSVKDRLAAKKARR